MFNIQLQQKQPVGLNKTPFNVSFFFYKIHTKKQIKSWGENDWKCTIRFASCSLVMSRNASSFHG